MVAVDPFVDDWKFGDPRTRARFEAHISASDLDDVVDLVAEYSTTVRPGWTSRWTCSSSTASTMSGRSATTCAGPATSSPTVPSSSTTASPRSGSPWAFWVTCCPAAGSGTNDESGHWRSSGEAGRRRPDRLRILRELPWWVRNLAVKVTLRLRLRRLTRALGHHSPYDPY